MGRVTTDQSVDILDQSVDTLHALAQAVDKASW